MPVVAFGWTVVLTCGLAVFILKCEMEDRFREKPGASSAGIDVMGGYLYIYALGAYPGESSCTWEAPQSRSDSVRARR